MRSKMPLSREFLSGRKVFTNASPSDDFETVRKMIYDREGIPVDQQRLSFVGKGVVDDYLPLSEYDNQDELSLQLDVKQQKNEFLLHVGTRSGKTKIKIEALSGDTIQDVKRKIMVEFGIPLNQQLLTFNSQEIEDEGRSLESYDIRNEMTRPRVDKQLITFDDTKLEDDNKLSDFGAEHGSTVLMTTQEKYIVS